MSVRGAEKALLVADFYVIEAKENSRLEVGMHDCTRVGGISENSA